jgi:hypothetical protein
MENFVRGIWAFWKETWFSSKPLFFAEACGTVMGMTAATLMALQAPTPDLVSVFTLYLISAILLMYSNYKRHSSWMVVLMTFYAVTTFIGLVRLLSVY